MSAEGDWPRRVFTIARVRMVRAVMGSTSVAIASVNRSKCWVYRQAHGKIRLVDAAVANSPRVQTSTTSPVCGAAALPSPMARRPVTQASHT